MRLERARHDWLQRAAIEIGEHGTHSADVLFPPHLAAVARVDHDPHGRAVAVADRERLQVIGRQVDHPGEVIGSWLRLGVSRGLKGEGERLLIDQRQEAASDRRHPAQVRSCADLAEQSTHSGSLLSLALNDVLDRFGQQGVEPVAHDSLDLTLP